METHETKTVTLVEKEIEVVSLTQWMTKDTSVFSLVHNYIIVIDLWEPVLGSA